MEWLRAAAEHDGRPALVAGDREWSHAALHDAAARAARLFAPGDPGLVFLFCRNTPGTVLAFLAARAAGHAVALLDATLGDDLRRDLWERYRPDWVAGEGPGPGEFVGAVEDLPVRRSPGGGSALHPDLAVLLSTSGTTGSPKLVRLSAAAVEANARSIARALALDAGERAIASLPLHYAYGLSVLDSHLVAGGCVVLTSESPIQRGFWEVFEATRCTSFAAVPYGYQVLLRAGVERMALPSLRNLTQAGGRLAPDLVLRFHEWIRARGGRIWVMYGQTEATARIAVLPAHRLPEKAGTAGIAIPEGTLLVDAGEGPSSAPGRAGEVVYRGPNVMMGYATSRADLGRGDDLAGELRTGDQGELDPEGFLTLHGRSARVGKVFGLRVNLDEVEGMLRDRGPVAVVAGDDELRVFCEWGDAADWGAAALDLGRRLRVHHGVIRFLRVDALPLSSSGKIDYRALRDEGR